MRGVAAAWRAGSAAPLECACAGSACMHAIVDTPQSRRPCPAEQRTGIRVLSGTLADFRVVSGTLADFRVLSGTLRTLGHYRVLSESGARQVRRHARPVDVLAHSVRQRQRCRPASSGTNAAAYTARIGHHEPHYLVPRARPTHSPAPCAGCRAGGFAFAHAQSVAHARTDTRACPRASRPHPTSRDSSLVVGSAIPRS
jgi:hypothetical protein